MGLPFGPGCPSGEIEFPLNIIIDMFGLFPDRCKWFGCDGGCGILGCGWCFHKQGCTECPKLLCPKGGPKPGPAPTPIKPPGPSGKKPQKCDPKDYKTATERVVACGEFVYLSSTASMATMASSASTFLSTVTSSCSTCHTALDVTSTGCYAVDFMTTTTTFVTKSISLSSDAPACTRAPLSLDDDEGLNEPIGFSSSISYSSNTTSASSTSSSKSSTKPSATPTPGPMDKNGV